MAPAPDRSRFIIQMSRWGRWSSGFRVSVGMAPVFLLVALTQFVGVRWLLGLSSGASGVPAEVLFWLLAGPIALGIFGAGLLIGAVTRWRIAELNAAFQRIAAGNLRAGMTPLGNRDFYALQRTFVAMVEALDAAQVRLREVDAQRRRLFADLAHELATPITSLECLTSVLLEPRSQSGQEATLALLSALSGEVERLAEFVRDLRSLAHLAHPEILVAVSRVDVGQIARGVADRFAAAGAGVGRITCHTEPSLVHADAGRIDQVVVNLLTNALRHTPARGPIDLRVELDGQSVVLSVRDRGPGVPQDRLPHLGTRLLRADRVDDPDGTSAGHGFGLAIVAAIVERAGGVLGFTNAPGGGLLATVCLPAIADAPAPLAVVALSVFDGLARPRQGEAVADAVDRHDG